MNWHNKNTHGGQLVASQTTNGDYKDLHVITGSEGVWALVSLLDGLRHSFSDYGDLITWLNRHRFVPVVKVLGTGPMPENRAGLPMVRIMGMRND